MSAETPRVSNVPLFLAGDAPHGMARCGVRGAEADAAEEAWGQCFLLGSGLVGGRPSMLQALTSCGKLDVLLSLFAAAFSLPKAQQFDAGDAPTVPSCTPQAQQPTTSAKMAKQVLRLISAVVGHASSPDVFSIQECGITHPRGDGGGGAGGAPSGGSKSDWNIGRWEAGRNGWSYRLMSALSYVCLVAPSESLAPDLVAELGALVAACHDAGGLHDSGVRQSTLSWLLRAELWAGRDSATLLEVVRQVDLMLEPHVKEHAPPLSALFDFLLEVCGCVGDSESEQDNACVDAPRPTTVHGLDVMQRPGANDSSSTSCPFVSMMARRRAHRLEAHERGALADACWSALAGACALPSSSRGALSRPRAMRAEDFEAIGHFVACCKEAMVSARLLWLTALLSAEDLPLVEEREEDSAPPPQRFARPKGWMNMLLHVMRQPSCMLAALYNLVLYMAALPQHHQV